MEGCNALLKNKDGRRARKLAAASRQKPAASACRRAEKTRSGSVDQLWAVRLYDFCYERQSTLLDQLASLDHAETRVVPSVVFLQVFYYLHRISHKKVGYHQRNVRQFLQSAYKAHFGLSWVRPWHNRGKCHMDEKRIQCL